MGIWEFDLGKPRAENKRDNGKGTLKGGTRESPLETAGIQRCSDGDMDFGESGHEMSQVNLLVEKGFPGI